MDDNFEEILDGPISRALLRLNSRQNATSKNVNDNIQELLDLRDDHAHLFRKFLTIGTSALNAFLQANVTGPPLTWRPENLIDARALLANVYDPERDVQTQLTSTLTIDGEAVYSRTPHLILFLVAKLVLNAECLPEEKDMIQSRFRVNAWHQRLLSQPASSLQSLIYRDMALLKAIYLSEKSTVSNEKAEFLLECAAVHLLHGQDDKARSDLQEATSARKFSFVLTGRLGKRTKFQVKETSQLVVLAKSSNTQTDTEADQESKSGKNVANENPSAQPEKLNLEDDTLLESISFTDTRDATSESTSDESVPATLALLDPSNQPLLHPLDAIILLSTASSVTKTSPQDGLTREETLPYAERVLSGGSSNWQVYTQALIVRSRIEGYKSRTVERGVLQLQAVVDQVIAETEPAKDASEEPSSAERGPATFLPKAKPSESAAPSERLKYIHQLAPHTRWKLEAELADRWVSIGALRTALDIYERLKMWAEVALCLAANGREQEAVNVIKKQLYEEKSRSEGMNGDSDSDLSKAQLPADAPRLLCILGDIENSPSAYERAWQISNHRYARAKRSLGKYYMKKGDLAKADEAYSQALVINPQNHGSWFTLGCMRLQTEDWSGSVEAFQRAVQIEDDDAESWSNMAVALINSSQTDSSNFDKDRAAFTAMKRATALKRENIKLWQNFLAVAVKLSPPPYADILMAQERLIDLLGPSKGEEAVDVPVLEALLSLIFQNQSKDSAIGGATVPSQMQKRVTDLVVKKITPLVTASRPLWLLIAKLDIHLQRPFAALSTYEKAWRSALNQPGWESTRKLWKNVSDATLDLIDAYESLGEMERESGLSAGEPVCKDWKFRARSAARSVLARAKESWVEDGLYEAIRSRLEDLKAS